MAQEAHSADLNAHAKPVVITTLVRDQIQRRPIEQEQTLQLRPREIADEPLVRGNLVISQEIEGHSRTTYDQSHPNADPPHPGHQDHR